MIIFPERQPIAQSIAAHILQPITVSDDYNNRQFTPNDNPPEYNSLFRNTDQNLPDYKDVIICNNVKC